MNHEVETIKLCFELVGQKLSFLGDLARVKIFESETNFFKKKGPPKAPILKKKILLTYTPYNVEFYVIFAKKKK